MNTPTPAGPRAPSAAWERRRRIIRRDIELRALEVFALKGFDAVSIEELAAAADISPRTFFRYFASKDDVVLAMPLRVAESMCDAVATRPTSESLLDSWRAVATGGATWDAADVQAGALFRQVIARNPSVGSRFSRHPALLEPFLTVIAERLGVDREQDMRPVVYANAIQGALHAGISRWALDREESLSALFLEALDVLSGLPEAGAGPAPSP